MTAETTAPKTDLLIADDEDAVRAGLRTLLEAEGYTVSEAADGRDTLDSVQKMDVGVILLDLDMPHVGGMDILEHVRRQQLPTQIIIITGKGTINTAVQAMHRGAYDYLTKPVSAERLQSVLTRALDHYKLLISNRQLQNKLESLTRYEDLIGASEPMKSIYQTIDTIADSTASVIITGESGTGKELVAKAIHHKSGRNKSPFLAVNCSAFPRDILENELFGHEAGAFTGALKEKHGTFELADQGTLFLDEVGDMPVETQVKLLRVLEEQRFRRLGGKREIQVDVRVLAATNQNLDTAIAENRFRQDLYYRLCVVTLHMPALRERPDDIPLLAQHFINRFSQQNHKSIHTITPVAQEILMQYSWPGNVRELRNVIERAVIFCSGSVIDRSHLPDTLNTGSPSYQGRELPVGLSLREAEQQLIQATLRANNHNKTRTARILGISLKTLYNKLHQDQNT